MKGLRIVVLGYVVRGPLGGMVWSNLQFLRGLRRLGHEAYFLEHGDNYASCYDPSRNVLDTDPSYGLRFAAAAFDRIDLDGRWAYFDTRIDQWVGPAAHRIRDVVGDADLVLNLCGVNRIHPWLLDVPARVLVDEDPAFTQVRHLNDATAREQAATHTAFFSFGENFGRSEGRIPDDGFPWQPTRQPLVLESVPVSTGKPQGRYTTVMLWDSYPKPTRHAGIEYGHKSKSFQPYLDLPKRANAPFEFAIGGHPPRDLLKANGWKLKSPLAVSKDPGTYEGFIRRSKAEFSIAKHGYVVSRCGWFSERSVTYLATGRPVVVENTGFSRWMDTGRGVLTFSNREEAIAAIAEIETAYETHCRTAREIAEAYFDSDKVLPSLLERALNPVQKAVHAHAGS